MDRIRQILSRVVEWVAQVRQMPRARLLLALVVLLLGGDLAWLHTATSEQAEQTTELRQRSEQIGEHLDHAGRTLQDLLDELHRLQQETPAPPKRDRSHKPAPPG